MSTTAALPQLDSRNANTLWASVLVETLYRCGVRQVVVSPGSRSTPLTFAFAQHAEIEAIPVLDERSAAFFALGLAKQTLTSRQQTACAARAERRAAVNAARQINGPAALVALLCTSGTAGANYLPAIIEAHESGVPLIVLTADRPPELRDCASGQTIDQQKLFGGFVRFYHELAVPEPRYELLCYLRQTVASACGRAVSGGGDSGIGRGGPVHLNIPFRDPLVPMPDAGETSRVLRQIRASFFEHFQAEKLRSVGEVELNSLTAARGVIIAGPEWGSEPREYAAQVARLARELGWPILADGVSPLRHHAVEGAVVVTAYDAILRNEVADLSLMPDQVLCLGDWPTSKVLRASLAASEPEIIQVSPQSRNRDALHGRTRQICAPLAALRVPPEKPCGSDYLNRWAKAEAAARAVIDSQASSRQLSDALSLSANPPKEEGAILEAAIVPTLARALPDGAAVFVASSMPIRDVEYFWPKTEHGFEFYFNRGANGIDGTLSTAIGVAHGSSAPLDAEADTLAAALRPTFLLCGDLSFLHDSNGLLLAQKLRGSLTVILINNHGGGIFEHLPVANYNPPFEEFFATPQRIDFGKLCAAHGVAHRAIGTLAELETELSRAPQQGLRVLELHTDRKDSAAHRKALLAQVSTSVI